MNWLKKLFNNDSPKPEHDASDIVSELNSVMSTINDAGSSDGKHFTDYVDDIKELKRQQRYEEAIDLLKQCVELTESQVNVVGEGWGVAPWYYEQLAIIYRKQKQYHQEVEILERYASQPKAPGVGPKKLAERLVKARELLGKHR